MRRLIWLAAVTWGCDDSGPITPPIDTGSMADVHDAAVDLGPADLGDVECVAANTCVADGTARYLRDCVGHQCVECGDDSDCVGRALGPACVGGRCVCQIPDGGPSASHPDCADNPNGPLCSGFPAFCGCTQPSDCASGTCASDPYVGGMVCAP